MSSSSFARSISISAPCCVSFEALPVVGPLQGQLHFWRFVELLALCSSVLKHLATLALAVLLEVHALPLFMRASRCCHSCQQQQQQVLLEAMLATCKEALFCWWVCCHHCPPQPLPSPCM
mmetsp:Transcript_91299/g.181489  ORF Transcript_91299/g.181489 Transcript_91299/m.181489 type:complete len:120 (-) Transcript_91299:132-491(-)